MPFLTESSGGDLYGTALQAVRAIIVPFKVTNTGTLMSHLSFNATTNGSNSRQLGKANNDYL